MLFMKKVLVSLINYSQTCPEAKKMLEDHGFEVLERCIGTDLLPKEYDQVIPCIDAAIASDEIWNEDMYRMAKKLKIIAKVGTGVDNIDLVKAREYGIQVTNTRGANANAVAELTLAFMINMLRNIPQLDYSTKRGGWQQGHGVELKGRTVGMLGFGAVPQALSCLLKGFDVRIKAYDKYPDSDKAKELNVEVADFDEVISTCDIISVHIPSSKDTYHLIGEEVFSKMKDGVYFINVGRGNVIDDKALYNVLVSGKVKAAALDVYEREPESPDCPLFKLDNIICTPHIGGSTHQSLFNNSMVTANAIIDYFEGRVPKNKVN